MSQVATCGIVSEMGRLSRKTDEQTNTEEDIYRQKLFSSLINTWPS